MKRIIMVVTSVALLVVPFNIAEAGGKRKKPPAPPVRVEREVIIEYSPSPNNVHTPIMDISFGVGYQALAGVNEHFVAVEIADDTGQPVHATLGEEGPDALATFCGSTDTPVSIDPDRSIYLYLWHGTCDTGAPSFPTGGTITFTFSNLP